MMCHPVLHREERRVDALKHQWRVTLERDRGLLYSGFTLMNVYGSHMMLNFIRIELKVKVQPLYIRIS